MNNELIERIEANLPKGVAPYSSARRIRDILGPYNDEYEALQVLVSNLVLKLDDMQEAKTAAPKDVEPCDESLARLRYDSEDLEALHMNFDRKGVPRHEDGMTLSAWGRAIRFAQSGEQQAEPIALSDFIRDNKFVTSVAKPKERDGVHSVSIHDLRQWMAGHARVSRSDLENVIWLAENPARARDANSKAKTSLIKCRKAMLTVSKESGQ